jgi:hypothetical protein
MKHRTPLLARLPAGLAFEIGDLVMLRGWADFHDLRLVVELDYSADGDEYEEVLSLYPSGSAFRRWLLWRGTADVVVQPMIGRAMHFASVAQALEYLIPTAAPRRPKRRRLPPVPARSWRMQVQPRQAGNNADAAS